MKYLQIISNKYILLYLGMILLALGAASCGGTADASLPQPSVSSSSASSSLVLATASSVVLSPEGELEERQPLIRLKEQAAQERQLALRELADANNPKNFAIQSSCRRAADKRNAAAAEIESLIRLVEAGKVTAQDMQSFLMLRPVGDYDHSHLTSKGWAELKRIDELITKATAELGL